MTHGQTSVLVVTSYETGWGVEVAGKPASGMSFDESKDLVEWFCEQVGCDPPRIETVSMPNPQIDIETIASKAAASVLAKIPVQIHSNGISKEKEDEIVARCLRAFGRVLSENVVMAKDWDVDFRAVTASLKEHADKLTGKGPKMERIVDQ
jgi:hypothetical protein